MKDGVQSYPHQHPASNDGTDIYAVKGSVMSCGFINNELEMVKSLVIHLSSTSPAFRVWTLQLRALLKS